MKKINEDACVETVNDRAKRLAEALGISLTRLASMMLMHASYFGTCTGKKVPYPTMATMRTLFPGLDVYWFFGGDGSSDISNVTMPKYVDRLTVHNPRYFAKVMSGEKPDVVRQFLADHDVPLSDFVRMYGGIYRALLPFLDEFPQDNNNNNDAPAPAPTHASEPTPVVVENLVRTVASLSDTVAAQQGLITRQQSVIDSLNGIISELQNTPKTDLQ